MNRRSFLSGTTGALGAGALVPFAASREWFGHQLDRLSMPSTCDDYSLASDITFFNHGSVGTIPRIVQEAQGKYLATCETNPWLYMWGGAWDEAREDTRKRAAEFLGCSADEVVINRNTTDGFNLLASGLRLKRGDEVLFSNFNHAGASVCWSHLAPERGFEVRHLEIPIARANALTTDEIITLHEKAITARTRVLVLPHMDNMVGIRTPLAEITKLARKRGVEFIFVDGAQAVAMLPVDVRKLGVDAYCTSPHKWLQAPKGIGLMYIRKDVQKQIRPQTVTWGQKRWKDSVKIFEDYGTRDVPAVLALGDAIAFHLTAGIEKTTAVRRKLWEAVRERVAATKRIQWRSPTKWELGGSLYAIEVENQDSQKLAARLWKEHKIVVRGFHSAELNTLRLSLNTANTIEEIDRVFAVLQKL